MLNFPTELGNRNFDLGYILAKRYSVFFTLSFYHQDPVDSNLESAFPAFMHTNFLIVLLSYVILLYLHSCIYQIINESIVEPTFAYLMLFCYTCIYQIINVTIVEPTFASGETIGLVGE